jgi:hypothetical protein
MMVGCMDYSFIQELIKIGYGYAWVEFLQHFYGVERDKGVASFDFSDDFFKYDYKSIRFSILSCAWWLCGLEELCSYDWGHLDLYECRRIIGTLKSPRKDRGEEIIEPKIVYKTTKSLSRRLYQERIKKNRSKLFLTNSREGSLQVVFYTFLSQIRICIL